MAFRLCCLPTRLRPAALSLRPNAGASLRTIYVRPKARTVQSPKRRTNQAFKVQSKGGAAEMTDPSMSNEERMSSRILETGGNLKLVEVLYLEHKRAVPSSKDIDDYDMKKKSKDSILREIYKDRSVLRNLIGRMCQIIMKDTSLQKFVLREIIRLKKNGNMDELHEVWELVKTGILKDGFTGANFKKVLCLQDSDSGFMKSITELSLYFNNVKVASQLVLKNDVDERVIKNVVNSLLVKNPRLEESTLNSIIEVCRKKRYQFDHYENSEILSEKIDSLNPFLQKSLLEFVMKNTAYSNDGNSEDHLKLRNYYKLIDINFKLVNIVGCYLTWTKIQIDFPELSIHDHDGTAISKLLKIFNRSSSYRSLSGDIIKTMKPFEKLQENGKNEIVLHNIINFAQLTSNINLFNSLLKTIEPPYQRRTLDELLRINLDLAEKNTNIESILKEIITTFGKLSPLENSIIVSSLIKRDKFEEALVFADNLEVKYAKNAYLVIIDKLINDSNGELSEKQLLIINRFLSNAQGVVLDEFYDFRRDPFWSGVNSKFFKYLSLKPENLSKLRHIYSNSTKNFTNKLYYLDNGDGTLDELKQIEHKSGRLDQIRLNPFQESNMIKFVLINDESKIMILRTIFLAARRYEDTNAINWCLKEFHSLGLTKLELHLDATIGLKTNFTRFQSKSLRGFISKWQREPKFIENRELLETLPGSTF